VKMLELLTQPRGELFTHIDDDTGKQTTFYVTGLARLCEANHIVRGPWSSSDQLALGDDIERTFCPIETHHAEYCKANRGVEAYRFGRLLEGGKDVILKPIIFVRQPKPDAPGGHSMLLIDGTHRYVLAHMAGARALPAYFVPWHIAAPFIIDDMPDEDPEALLKSWSGL
jgi:hypothetical protein